MYNKKEWAVFQMMFNKLKLLFFLLITVVISSSYSSLLYADELILVAPKQTALSNRVLTLLSQQLPEDEIVFWPGQGDAPSKSKQAIYILLGVKALAIPEIFDKIGTHSSVSILAAKDQLAPYAAKISTSIYAEPPFYRQLLLAQQIFPGATIGVLAKSTDQKKTLLNESRKYVNKNLLEVEVIANSNINQALYKLLKQSDLLVAAYDLELYKAKNIKNILVTSYRQNKVLVGPSKAYLRSGAYATIYSNLNDINKMLAETIIEYRKNNSWPLASYNHYYRVKINQRVAKSLGIPQQDERALAKAIKKIEDKSVAN